MHKKEITPNLVLAVQAQIAFYKMQEQIMFAAACKSNNEAVEKANIARQQYLKTLTLENISKIQEIKAILMLDGFEECDVDTFQRYLKVNEETTIHFSLQYLPKIGAVRIEHCSCHLACCGRFFKMIPFDLPLIYKQLKEYWNEP